MPEYVDDIELDESNVEFKYALDALIHGQRIIYLTGKAGTGKTTFLKYVKQTLKKNSVIVAPTGIAAINAGGQTIHSFFKIKPSVYVPFDKRLRQRVPFDDPDKTTIYDHIQLDWSRKQSIKNLDLLVIDEVSMVRCDLLDVVDRILRVYRSKIHEPFGGVQTILIGDAFQLSPVAEQEEWEILRPFYESPYFFSSRVLTENKPFYIELKKIYRQTELEFIELLNRIRVNHLSPSDITVLNNRCAPVPEDNQNRNYITLATHTLIVDATNSSKLAALKEPLNIFKGSISGIFPTDRLPTLMELQLKVGAQVMFIKNYKNNRIFNGTIGKVISIEEEVVTVEYNVQKGTILRHQVKPDSWQNVRYTWNNKENKVVEEVIGEFTQLPLKLAWAVTIHKSQGLTFDNVVVDIGAAFAPGQVYVALSRCTSFNGLYLKAPIDAHVIKTSPAVLQFAENEIPETLIVQELNSGKADFYYRKTREDIRSRDFASAYQNLCLAIKYRNDVETDTFRRFFIVFAHRIVTNSPSFQILLKESAALNKEINSIQSTNLNLRAANTQIEEKLRKTNKAVVLLQHQLNSLDAEKKQQNKELHTKIETVTNDNSDLRSKIKDIEFVLHKEREINNKLMSENKKNVAIISKQEVTISELQAEISRLKNIKWHQKLLGAK